MPMPKSTALAAPEVHKCGVQRRRDKAPALALMSLTYWGDGVLVAKIFINYRREDAKDQAARLRDRLTARDAFGEANVFMDVDRLLAGQRFDLELQKALAGTDVFLAVIGPRWMDILRARQASGERDYVLEEIVEALKRGLPVIPVLVDRAPLPRPADLPQDIRDLVLHQKHDLIYESFGRDIAALIGDIKLLLKMRAKPSSRPPWKAIAALALAVVSASGYFLLPSRVSQPVVPAVDVPGSAQAPAVAHEKPNDTQVVVVAPPKSPPALPQPIEDACDGILVTVALSSKKPCIKPGSGQSFKDCPDCSEMVIVPSGSFMMGSPESEAGREFWKKGTESPRHEVFIGKPFAVGKFSVTFEEWDACMSHGGCNGYRPSDEGWGRGRQPVINVFWDDAATYVNWVSKKAGKRYRLLTEAEREYVTRAGTTTPFWWGSTISTRRANYDGKYTYSGGLKGERRNKPLNVDAFEPNPWGLYNVHGNVWEWVSDCWVDSYQDAPRDGMISATDGDCISRVIRGGAWSYIVWNLRAASRYRFPSPTRGKDIGFRIARAL
jgi:formylglycine-generating enzyme required for sulfatase activity